MPHIAFLSFACRAIVDFNYLIVVRGQLLWLQHQEHQQEFPFSNGNSINYDQSHLTTNARWKRVSRKSFAKQSKQNRQQPLTCLSLAEDNHHFQFKYLSLPGLISNFLQELFKPRYLWKFSFNNTPPWKMIKAADSNKTTSTVTHDAMKCEVRLVDAFPLRHLPPKELPRRFRYTNKILMNVPSLSPFSLPSSIGAGHLLLLETLLRWELLTYLSVRVRIIKTSRYINLSWVSINVSETVESLQTPTPHFSLSNTFLDLVPTMYYKLSYYNINATNCIAVPILSACYKYSLYKCIPNCQ